MSHARGRGTEPDPSNNANKSGATTTSSKIGGSPLIQAYGGAVAAPSDKVGGTTLTSQLDAGGSAAGAGDVHQIASHGVAGGGGPLPHGETIQRAFGHHDVSGVQAHVGGDAQAASRALGAEGYATGSHVAFAGAPSLHTAAHEAAHVVQQQGGVQLKGGVGSAGDVYERHADAVADRVVQGGAAEALLDPYAGKGGGSSGAAVQRQADPAAKPADPAAKPADPAAKPADPAAKPAADPAAVAAAIQKLDAVTKPSFAGIKDDTFSIDGFTTWVDAFAKTLGEAKTVASSGSSPELTQAVDRCLGAHAPDLTQVAEQIRTAALQLTNDSSVTKSDPTKAVFPT